VEKRHRRAWRTVRMHPLVRDLYKRVLIVGRDYPHPGGLEFVKRKWKAAILDGERNWPLHYQLRQQQQQHQEQQRDAVGGGGGDNIQHTNERSAFCGATETKAIGTPQLIPSASESELDFEIKQAVHRGRHMVKEMIGAVQLKKYREMKKRYDGDR
jgi:hypothetical protein